MCPSPLSIIILTAGNARRMTGQTWDGSAATARSDKRPDKDTNAGFVRRYRAERDEAFARRVRRVANAPGLAPTKVSVPFLFRPSGRQRGTVARQ